MEHFTLPWEIQKVIFNIIIHILQIVYITSEATAVLQFLLFTYCCLVLPIICIALVLHLGLATWEARVLLWTSWLVAIRAEFQHSIVYYATDQC